MSRAQSSVSSLTGAMSPDLETTGQLLALVRQGDSGARERLIRRFLPVLTRWARGRLPAYARDLAETDDLVQVTLVRSLSHLDEFDDRGEGAFFAYLRRALLNAIRDEIRRSRRHPARQGLDGAIADQGRSVVEDAIGSEALERYEAALAELSEEQRAAVILKLEFGMSNPELAAAMGKPTPNAARMVVARALVRIAEAMDEFRS
jgi:RNA polymerase sigma-70 factor (ECF subfamily)